MIAALLGLGLAPLFAVVAHVLGRRDGYTVGYTDGHRDGVASGLDTGRLDGIQQAARFLSACEDDDACDLAACALAEGGE